MINTGANESLQAALVELVGSYDALATFNKWSYWMEGAKWKIVIRPIIRVSNAKGNASKK